MTEPSTVLNGAARGLGDRFDLTLLDWLRERMSLHGTKFGCGEGRCGSCSVLVDGRAVLSCLTPLGQVAGRTVTTIEGLAGDPHAEEAMARLADADALQCGFCTPGVVVALTGLAKQSGPSMGADQVCAGLAGNLCRCTGYRPIVDAALQMRVPAEPMARAWGATIETATYRRPLALADALAARGSGPWTAVAGGTDLYLRDRSTADHDRLLDLSGVGELAEITETTASVRIGATAPYRDVIASPLVQQWCAPLAEAAAQIGGAQVQHQGTIGGALVAASPTSDALPTLAVLGADVELRSATATRTIAYRDFVHGPGATALRPDELVTAIVVGKHAAIDRRVGFFRKAADRRAQAISILSVAVAGDWDGHQLRNAAVCFGAIGGVAQVSDGASDVLAAGPLDAARVALAARTAAGPTVTLARARLMEGLLLRGCYDIGLLG